MKLYILLSPNHDMVPRFNFHRYADSLVEAYARELYACDVIKNMLSREFLFYAQKKRT